MQRRHALLERDRAVREISNSHGSDPEARAPGMLALRFGKVELDDLGQSRRYVLSGELIYPPEKPVIAEIGGNVPDGKVVGE